MKYCSNCGTQMEDDSLFCQSCGTPAAPVEQPAPAAPEEQPAPEQSQQAEPEMAWPSDYVAPPPKRKPRLLLWIGIPAAVVVLAAGTVLALALTAYNPMLQFGNGLRGFFNNFGKLPGNEISTRMERGEPCDISLTTDLSKLAGQLSPGSEGMAGDISVNAGVKTGRTEGGLRVSVATSGVEMFNFSGIIADDELMAGYAMQYLSESQMISTLMKLKSKPGDSIEKKLAELYAGGNQKMMQEIEEKLLKYATESVEPGWFTMENATLRDALSGNTIDTKAAVLRLDSAKTIKLLDSIEAKLDRDPDFYADMDDFQKAQGAFGGTGTDSRTQFKEALRSIREELSSADFEIALLVHYAGSAPAAMELTVKGPESEAMNVNMLLQKIVKGDQAAYEFSYGINTDAGDVELMKLHLEVDKVEKGYEFEGGLSAGLFGTNFSFGLKGSAEIRKKSSNEYNVDTNLSINWSIPDSGTGNLDLALRENVLLGSSVVPVKQDKAYMYDKLREKAKQVATIEDFYAAFSSFAPATYTD